MSTLRRFTFVSGKTAKFWEIAVEGDAVTVRYGRIGTDGQSKTKSHGSVEDADKEAAKLIRSKTKKGYVEEGGLPSGAAPKKAAKRAPANDAVVDQLPLFRKARFVREPDFGEISFLKAGATPELAEHGEGLPFQIADWFAEEADGAVVGRLRLDGVSEALRPIVVIDNEGCARLTGFNLVDHFGSYTMAAYREELEPLHRLCKKHGLPAPRKDEAIAAIAKRLKLRNAQLDKGKVPKIDEATLAAVAAEAPALPKPKKKPAVRAGKTVVPGSQFCGRVLDGDGQWLFVVPPKNDTKSAKTQLCCWDGEKFILQAKLRGWTTKLQRHDGLFVYGKQGEVIFHDGEREVKAVTYETDNNRGEVIATPKHLVVYDTWNGKLARVQGDQLKAVPGDYPKQAEVLAVLDDERVFMASDPFEGKEQWFILDLKTGKTKKWTKPKSASMHTAWMLHEGRLFASGYECIEWSPATKAKWTTINKKLSLGGLAPLDNGRFVAFATKVFAKETQVLLGKPRGASYTLSSLGTLAVHRGESAAVAAQFGDQLVVVGGTGDRGKALPPEVMDLKTGTSRVLG